LPASSTPDESALSGLLRAMGPIIEFHKAVEDADDNDLRMFWDIRILRGSGETFITSTGSSSFPDALGPKQRANAAIAIQQEVHEKIAVPLVGKMQAAVEIGALESATKTRKTKLLAPPEDPKPSGNALLDAADAVDV
jgi:hypothetical protein